MPIVVKKIKNKYRLVEQYSNKLVRKDGKAVDGGGHSTREAAVKQMQAINISKSKRR